LLGDWQGIHVGAKANGAIAGAGAQDADNTCALVNLKPQIAQVTGNKGFSARLLHPKFGIAVQIMPDLDKMRVA
jgi:hypothetical protein